MKSHELMPALVRQLCWMYNAVIVGGAVDYLTGKTTTKPKDIDVIVPIDEWVVASKLLTGATANSFGGFMLEVEDFQVDVWADDALRCVARYNGECKIFSPKTNKVYVVEKDVVWPTYTLPGIPINPAPYCPNTNLIYDTCIQDIK